MEDDGNYLQMNIEDFNNFAVLGKSSILQQNNMSYSFVHRIQDPDQIQNFFDAPNGHRIKSKTFVLDDYHFQLYFYPNGRFETQINDLVIHLCLQNLIPKSDLSAVFLDWTLFIGELGISQIVKGRHHSDVARCRGFVFPDFHRYIVTEFESETIKDAASKIPSLTFEVGVAVQSVLNASTVNKGLVPMSIDKHLTMNWIIEDTATLDAMQLAQHQQTFLSVSSTFWYLTFSPNGFHEKGPGSLDVFLNLLALPDGLDVIKMQCVYSIMELDLSHSLTATWSRADKGWGWKSGRYSNELLHDQMDSIQSLNITVDCTVLKVLNIYDQNLVEDDNWETILAMDPNAIDFAAMFLELDAMTVEALMEITEDVFEEPRQDATRLSRGGTANILLNLSREMLGLLVIFNVTIITSFLTAGFCLWHRR